jgi:hypothetical protein
MERLEEYARHANDCREAARKSRSVSAQEHLFQMAEHWEQLARQRAAYLHLENILAELFKDRNGGAAP